MAITLEQLADRYRVSDASGFQLANFDPGDTWKLKSKEHAQAMLDQSIEDLSDLQAKLYAQDSWALLVVLQAMDAAGKDGIIKHVLSGINPQGCEVSSFKAPSNEELDHDFLWRCHYRLPARGRIGIFNRSYYEEVLVVRVHREWLDRQRLPRKLVTHHIWKERFTDIASFESYAHRNGIVIRKFFLHLSKHEQKKRFLERLEEPEKNWKFSLADSRERQYWARYMSAYEDMIRHTAAPHAPWHIVPADHKWFARLVVASVITETLRGLKLEYPSVDAARRKELGVARAALNRTK